MNTYNFDVNFATGRIYGPDLLLVVNDHNSTTFKFTFDQEGRYVFKLLYPDNTVYVQDIINEELVLTKGVLNQEGNYKFEISLYGDDNRLTTARIKEFPVRLELVETDEPVQADDRLPILDNLIEETNKVVEAAKNGEFDGATFTPSVSDNGDLSWTNDKGKENPPTVNIAGPPGAPGAVKMQVVDTLPQVGDTDTIYLLKKDTPGEQNLYDEYVYTETSGWEHIGDTSVDLTDYYTKEETEEKLNSKQDALTAGNNITIENNVISASGGNDFLVITTPTYLSFTSSGTISKDLTDINKEDILNCLNSGSYDKPILLKTHLDSDGYQETYIFNVSTIQLRYNRFQYVLDKIYQTTNYPYNLVLLSLKPTGKYPNYTDVSATVNMFYRGNIMKTTDVLLRNNTSSYTPTSDYNPATKKYVDDNKYTLPVASAETLGGIKLGEGLSVDENGVVSASDSKNAIYSIEFNNVSLPQRSTIYANDFGNYKQTLLDFISNTLNNSYLKNQTPIMFMNFKCSNYISGIPYLILNKADSNTILSAASGLFYMLSDVKFVNNKYYYYRVEIRYTYENNIFTCTMIQFDKTQRDMLDIYNALSKENTTSFTPTNDYNPATKKYVDDSIATLPSLPIYDFKMTSPFTKYNPPTTYTYMTSTDKTTLQNIIQSAYDKGLESVVLIARQKYGTYTGTNEQTQDYLLTTVNNSKNLIKNKPTALMLDGYNHGSMTMSDNHLSRLSILFTLKWSGNTCTVGQAQYINKDITIATQTDYQTYAGYDATKTQILKNVNGNLTWVNEG